MTVRIEAPRLRDACLKFLAVSPRNGLGGVAAEDQRRASIVQALHDMSVYEIADAHPNVGYVYVGAEPFTILKEHLMNTAQTDTIPNPISVWIVEGETHRLAEAMLSSDRQAFEPHQLRVFEEYLDLKKKLQALMTFRNGSVHDALPWADREALTRQQSYMTLYLDVLAERICRFDKD